MAEPYQQYIAPLQAIFRETFHEGWMNDEDWKEVQEQLFLEIGSSYEKMAQDVVAGEARGASAEFQLQLLGAYMLGQKREHENAPPAR